MFPPCSAHVRLSQKCGNCFYSVRSSTALEILRLTYDCACVRLGARECVRACGHYCISGGTMTSTLNSGIIVGAVAGTSTILNPSNGKKDLLSYSHSSHDVIHNSTLERAVSAFFPLPRIAAYANVRFSLVCAPPLSGYNVSWERNVYWGPILCIVQMCYMESMESHKILWPQNIQRLPWIHTRP